MAPKTASSAACCTTGRRAWRSVAWIRCDRSAPRSAHFQAVRGLDAPRLANGYALRETDCGPGTGRRYFSDWVEGPVREIEFAKSLPMENSPLSRVASAWSRHGPLGFLRLIGKNTAHYTGQLVSGRLFAQDEYATSEFDQAYGMDTERIREIGSLDIARSQNARHAVRYQPSPQREATEAIHSLQINHAQFSFLDFGAGKGRVLVIAGELPFKAVIGIELSRELCEVATKNVAKIDAAKRVAARIECVNADAASYPLPDTPLVCYFYNPFDRVIMGNVVDQLVDSLRKTPREMLIIYLHPAHRALFEDSGYWSLVSENKSFLVLRSNPPRSARKQ